MKSAHIRLLEAKKACALQLLYRTEEPPPNAPRYQTYAAVAKVLKMSYGQLYHLCKQAKLNAKRRPR